MDKLHCNDKTDAIVKRIADSGGEILGLNGVYTAIGYDVNGKEKWRDEYPNTVVTVGKNLTLDTLLAGSAYTVTGPYMGLISSVGYSAIAAGDTMASHSGWNEAGSGVNYPLYTGTRKTAVFSAASGGSKALSSSLTFVCETTGGTVKGSFIVLGTGAVATIADTNGTLLSAGLFTGGDKTLAVGESVAISYTLSA